MTKQVQPGFGSPAELEQLFEVALRKSSSLATVDDHLRSAAQEAGVEIFGA
jgi:hypothetical protein